MKLLRFAFIFLFLNSACSKDSATPKGSESAGSWTLGTITFQAKTYTKFALDGQWFSTVDGYNNTNTPFDLIAISFTGKFPDTQGTFRVGSYNNEVNFCHMVRVVTNANTANQKVYSMPQFANAWGSGSVEVFNGKRYLNINSIKVYEISGNVLVDSSTVSVSRLEY